MRSVLNDLDALAAAAGFLRAVLGDHVQLTDAVLKMEIKKLLVKPWIFPRSLLNCSMIVVVVCGDPKPLIDEGLHSLSWFRAYLHIATKMPSSKLHGRFIEASSNFSWSCTTFSMKCR